MASAARRSADDRWAAWGGRWGRCAEGGAPRGRWSRGAATLHSSLTQHPGRAPASLPTLHTMGKKKRAQEAAAAAVAAAAAAASDDEPDDSEPAAAAPTIAESPGECGLCGKVIVEGDEHLSCEQLYRAPFALRPPARPCPARGIDQPAALWRWEGAVAAIPRDSGQVRRRCRRSVRSSAEPASSACHLSLLAQATAPSATRSPCTPAAPSR